MRALVVLLFASLAAAAHAAPQSSSWYGDGYGAPGQVVRCESRDGRALHCPMDTSQGVRLVRQISGSACVQGRSWGYDRDGVWVGNGCRGEFASYYSAGYYGGYGAYGNTDYGNGYYGNGYYGNGYYGNDGSGYYGSGGYADPYPGGYHGGYDGSAAYGNGLIRCESTEGRWRRCAADTRGGVEIVRQMSGASCIRGRTWGWDDRGVWVDGGCRAEFRSALSAYGQGRLLRCESIDGRFRECLGSGRGSARLVRQLSGSACIEGRTWGSRRGGVWVDGGCRGDFLLDARRGWRDSGSYGYDTGYGRTVRCASDDGRTRRCGVAAQGVQLQRQLSDSPCLSGRTWGWDRAGIWVTRGCRADFAVW